MSINTLKATDIRYNKIRTVLRDYLKREPLDHEIINAQNDTFIIQRVIEQETKESFDKIKT